MIAREFWPSLGTPTGPVRHGEDTHPSNSGLRSVTSLLYGFPHVDTPATRTVRARERRRTNPFFSEDDRDTARLRRVVWNDRAVPVGVQ